MNDRSSLINGLRQTPAIFAALMATIPEDRLHLRRRKGFWTIAEHASHLALVQPMLLERLERFTAEENPAFVPFIPADDQPSSGSPEVMDASIALSQFEDYRQRQVALMEDAGPSVWANTGSHPEYAQYSFYILARHILMHDHWHLYRVEELWLTRDDFLTVLGG